MIMKYLLLICLHVLSFLPCSANEVQIKLTKKDRMIDTRSISSNPYITHDNNVIYIYTSFPLKNTQIIVKDEMGNPVYSDYIIDIYNHYSLFINNTEKGIHTIYLIIDEAIEYYGIFHINE